MNILGISCFYHDAAAALWQDGKIIAAASQERFTRKKHDPDFPLEAIRYVLREGGIKSSQLDYVGFYDKPLIKFERLLTTYIGAFPRGLKTFLMAMPVWMKEKLWVPQIIRRELGYDGPIIFTEHHQSHAASAFHVSPFREAAILTVDGVGEWATSTLGRGQGRKLELLREIYFPHSLGLLYSAFTYWLGFKVNSAEYKVMGLAPYGEPKYVDLIRRELIDLKPDGSFALNMRYFGYLSELVMTSPAFDELFGRPPRAPESALEQIHKDVAASIQRVTEDVVLALCRRLHQEVPSENLCMAGGVALNCVANGRVLREGPFKNLFVQPAAGDAGGAVGAAVFIANQLLDQPRDYVMDHAYLGPAYSDEEIQAVLDAHGAVYRRLDRDALLDHTVDCIEQQRVVGWFQGRMEFGPRALGSRSILADARNPANKDLVNLKIKFRESFRPFAPTVLAERAGEYFELDQESPYMLLVAQVREDKRVIPAVTHVDGSARIQTIRRETNPLYYDLIKRFDERTGCPVIINTSFNVRGEPIVCAPQQAYLCFMRTHMDDLIIGSYVLRKEDQPALEHDTDWQSEFELD